MNYLSAVEIVENVVLRWVPRPVITGMAATAIPEASKAVLNRCRGALVFEKSDDQAHRNLCEGKS
jgi:hypothetical protein